MTYIPSEENLVLKLGEGDHKTKLFINKASNEAINDGKSFANTPKGMKTLAKKLKSPKADKRKITMIGVGPQEIPEVISGLESGEVQAYQYHGEGHESPSWGISLGFVSDVKAKNTQYGKKRGTRVIVSKKVKKKDTSLI